MMSFQTDNGVAKVEPQGPDFWLVTMPVYGHIREMWVAAPFADEAAQKAHQFWYGKSTKTTKI